MQTLTLDPTNKQDISFGVALQQFKARYSEPLTLPPRAVDGDDYTYASSVSLKPIREVTPMSLSANAIKLAHRYMGIVNKYETEYTDSGYTPREMELIRTKAHNELIAQLRAENIDVSDRAATTELARLVDAWLRE